MIKERTFLEAVKILQDGRCKKIMPYDWDERHTGYEVEHNALGCGMGGGIYQSLETFLGKWKCIGMKPRTEERMVKYWLIVWNDKPVTLTTSVPTKAEQAYAQQIIPINYTYTYAFLEEAP